MKLARLNFRNSPPLFIGALALIVISVIVFRDRYHAEVASPDYHFISLNMVIKTAQVDGSLVAAEGSVSLKGCFDPHHLPATAGGVSKATKLTLTSGRLICAALVDTGDTATVSDVSFSDQRSNRLIFIPIGGSGSVSPLRLHQDTLVTISIDASGKISTAKSSQELINKSSLSSPSTSSVTLTH